jgi:hypothetical protein
MRQRRACHVAEACLPCGRGVLAMWQRRACHAAEACLPCGRGVLAVWQRRACRVAEAGPKARACHAAEACHVAEACLPCGRGVLAMRQRRACRVAEACLPCGRGWPEGSCLPCGRGWPEGSCLPCGRGWCVVHGCAITSSTRGFMPVSNVVIVLSGRRKVPSWLAFKMISSGLYLRCCPVSVVAGGARVSAGRVGFGRSRVSAGCDGFGGARVRAGRVFFCVLVVVGAAGVVRSIVSIELSESLSLSFCVVSVGLGLCALFMVEAATKFKVGSGRVSGGRGCEHPSGCVSDRGSVA